MIDSGATFTLQVLENSVETTRYSWNVPSDCPYMDGHFPERPILPGFAVIDGSLVAIETKVGSPVELREVIKGKFREPIEPGMNCVMTVSRQAENGYWDVSWEADGKAAAELCLAVDVSKTNR